MNLVSRQRCIMFGLTSIQPKCKVGTSDLLFILSTERINAKCILFTDLSSLFLCPINYSSGGSDFVITIIIILLSRDSMRASAMSAVAQVAPSTERFK